MMMKRLLFALVPLAALLALPFLLRPAPEIPVKTHGEADRLIILTPHPESIRYEFERAFAEYYRNRFNREVELDFRSPGGTSDIVRYIADRYAGEFRIDCEKAGIVWNEVAVSSFADPRIDRNEHASPEAEKIRKRFLASRVGIGADLFWGGGTYDHQRQADRGFSVNSGLVAKHPEIFREESIPAVFAGEKLYDPRGRFFGVCLSSFGICYNPDRLAELKLAPPKSWRDLADPRYFNEIAIADPTKSGSINKCFEILIQSAMARSGDSAKGWDEAMRTITLIVANSRTVADSAGRVTHEVASGNAAAGMAIDFYALSEKEWTASQSGGRSRIEYVAPAGESAVSADPVSFLRGAPNPEVARAFIEFLLSPSAQRLWNQKVGTPGGPRKYALRRVPIRREFYHPEYAMLRSDPGYNPYEAGRDFVYRGEWTGRYFNLIRVLIRCSMLDVHDELRREWKNLIAAGGAARHPEAFERLTRPVVAYPDAAEAARKLSVHPGHSAIDVAAYRRTLARIPRAL